MATEQLFSRRCLSLCNFSLHSTLEEAETNGGIIIDTCVLLFIFCTGRHEGWRIRISGLFFIFIFILFLSFTILFLIACLSLAVARPSSSPFRDFPQLVSPIRRQLKLCKRVRRTLPVSWRKRAVCSWAGQGLAPWLLLLPARREERKGGWQQRNAC